MNDDNLQDNINHRRKVENFRLNITDEEFGHASDSNCIPTVTIRTSRTVKIPIQYFTATVIRVLNNGLNSRRKKRKSALKRRTNGGIRKKAERTGAFSGDLAAYGFGYFCVAFAVCNYRR